VGFLLSEQVNMSEASKTPPETARKAVAMALQRLQQPGTAAAVAVAMGTSEATISRIRNERMEEVFTFISHLGLKVVPAEQRCVDREAYDFLVRTHQRIMEKHPDLIFGAQE
jgi:hypothetical protein